MSTVPVGEKKWTEPSRGEVNWTPSSRILASGLPVLLSPRLKTWNPPLSVKISPSRCWKRWSPQSLSIMSSPGWRCRWNVLLSMSLIGVLVPNRWVDKNSSGNALIVAWVPTGMKHGVCIVTPLRVNSPTLAFPLVFTMLNFSFCMYFTGDKHRICIFIFRHFSTWLWEHGSSLVLR